jgi:hypothetical protein
MEIFLHGSGDITSINKKYLHRLCSEFEFDSYLVEMVEVVEVFFGCNQVIDR